MGFIDKALSIAGYAKKDMYHDATFRGIDNGGNFWYMPTWLQSLFGNSQNIYKNNFDLSTIDGKRDALAYCQPFSMVVDRCSRMMQAGRFYVVDSKGNEKPRFRDVVELLSNPNPMQNGKSFLYQVETCLRAYGFCPIYLLRVGSGVPKAMSVIPPYWFHMEGTGKSYSQIDKSDIVKRAYVKKNDTELELEDNEYCVIYNSAPIYPAHDGDEILFQSPVDSLSIHCRNYMSAMIARSNIIVNGGPKGIVYGDDNSETGNAMMSPSEVRDMNDKFKTKYGLVKKEYEIMVTNKKVGYLKLGSSVAELGLHNEAEACVNEIINGLGAQPDLFAQGSTYENKEAAKRATYQDLIIPDADNICEALTTAFGLEGARITLDFTDVPCLQEDRAKYAENLGKVSKAVVSMINAGLLTTEEARIELAKYIDINPTDNLEALSRAETDTDVQTTAEDI